jgi:hypothetical protein
MGLPVQPGLTDPGSDTSPTSYNAAGQGSHAAATAREARRKPTDRAAQVSSSPVRKAGRRVLKTPHRPWHMEAQAPHAYLARYRDMMPNRASLVGLASATKGGPQ